MGAIDKKRLFIMGDPHVNRGDWDVFTGHRSAIRRAVMTAYEEAWDYCQEYWCKAFVHTGDFTDGPLRNPNLTPKEFAWAYETMYRLRGMDTYPVKSLRGPRGNHDHPKSDLEHITVWDNLRRSFRKTALLETLQILCLDYQQSQTAFDLHFEAQFELLQEAHKKNVYRITPEAPRLILAHAFWETRVFDREKDIFFRAEWLDRVKDKFPNTLLILGHDHTPVDISDSVYVIGTPVHTDFGDDPCPDRRFFMWDYVTGELEYLPVRTKLHHYRIATLQELKACVKDPQTAGRVEISIPLKKIEQMEEVQKLSNELRAAGVEVHNRSTFVEALPELEIVCKGFSILDNFRAFSKARKDPPFIRSMGMDFLKKAGA